MNPIGSEFMKARVASLLAEAARDAHGRDARSKASGRRGRRSSLRVRLGLGLVGAGFRLLGNAPEAVRAGNVKG
jgi:hypothetical protein